MHIQKALRDLVRYKGSGSKNNRFKRMRFALRRKKMREFYLLYFPESKPAGLPCPPVAQIALKSLSRNEAGDMLLTPRCHSIEELKWWIDSFRKDLDVIERDARKKFSNSIEKGRD